MCRAFWACRWPTCIFCSPPPPSGPHPEKPCEQYSACSQAHRHIGIALPWQASRQARVHDIIPRGTHACHMRTPCPHLAGIARVLRGHLLRPRLSCRRPDEVQVHADLLRVHGLEQRGARVLGRQHAWHGAEHGWPSDGSAWPHGQCMRAMSQQGACMGGIHRHAGRRQVCRLCSIHHVRGESKLAPNTWQAGGKFDTHTHTPPFQPSLSQPLISDRSGCATVNPHCPHGSLFPA